MPQYYLIPFETDSNLLFCDAQPKYLDLLGEGARGFIALEQAPVGSKRTWKQAYYIVKTINAATALDAMTDVIELTQANLSKTPSRNLMSALGIDVTGLDAQSTLDEYMTRIFAWLYDDATLTLDRI